MKIILSRKGFDANHGGYPSPIINGTPLSLPIPDQQDKIRYTDLAFDNKSYLQLINELGINNYNRESTCHFDPDLVSNALPNRILNPNWRGTLGQMMQAQKHLENQKVNIGDLFLFFGWFKETEYIGNQLIYKKNSKYPDGFHLIYGYLQIAGIIKTTDKNSTTPLKKYSWLKNHPHFSREEVRNIASNTIYIGAKKLTLSQNQAGFGLLPFSEKLILTKAYHSRSRWDLEKLKKLKGLNISYHNQNSWHNDYFQSACIGQEFVIEECQQSAEWLTEILK